MQLEKKGSLGLVDMVLLWFYYALLSRGMNATLLNIYKKVMENCGFIHGLLVSANRISWDMNRMLMRFSMLSTICGCTTEQKLRCRLFSLPLLHHLPFRALHIIQKPFCSFMTRFRSSLATKILEVGPQCTDVWPAPASLVVLETALLYAQLES